MVPNHVGIDGALGARAPRLVRPAARAALPGLLASPAPTSPSDPRSAPDRGPLLVRAPTPRWSSSGSTDRTGEVRYLYHGNDGTNMPWNDTAQLDYLKPEVREAVIQPHPARRAALPDHPLRRRDDAGQAPLPPALVPRAGERRRHPLARRARPCPGGVRRGDARGVLARGRRPLRRRGAGHAAARRGLLADGELLRPDAGDAPGLQQRLHGLLSDEDNAKYRRILKETLDFDAEILYRFVNFLNNPDERTAVDQFGKGDKYFGICDPDGDAAGAADVANA